MATYQEKVKRYKRKSKLEAKYHELLRAKENELHELKNQLARAHAPFEQALARANATNEDHLRRLHVLEQDLVQLRNDRIDMILHCPMCNHRHIDEGTFATKDHHTHACQHCGHVWRPAIGPTRGVQFLPGFKNG